MTDDEIRRSLENHGLVLARVDRSDGVVLTVESRDREMMQRAYNDLKDHFETVRLRIQSQP